MKLAVDFDNKDCDNVLINKAKKYTIIDSETGRVLGKKSGAKIINETPEFGEKPYANVVYHETVNIGTVFESRKYMIANNMAYYNPAVYTYKYVFIDCNAMKVAMSNFDDLIIAIFKCANKFYFRIDKWIWQIGFNASKNPASLVETGLDMLEIGWNYLTWGINGNLCDTLCVDCIMYNKLTNTISFRMCSYRSHIHGIWFKKSMGVTRSRIDLNTGVMSTFNAINGVDLDSQGTDLDLFNRNLVFGG